MSTINISVAVLLLVPSAVLAQRIKQPPPNEAEQIRSTVEDAMNDSLHIGDIIVTTNGFLQLRAIRPDKSFDFEKIENPLTRQSPGTSPARRTP
jgi:hypothetical protein